MEFYLGNTMNINMKQKTIKTIVLIALIATTSISSYAALGGLGNVTKTTKGGDSSPAISSADAQKQADALTGKYSKACYNFLMSRAHAEDACGNNEKSIEWKTKADNVLKEKDLEKIAQSVSEATKLDAKEALKSADLNSDKAKESIKDSVKFFAFGTVQEGLIAKDISDLVKKVQSASPIEKAKILANIKPIIDLAQVIPTDVKNATNTLGSYYDFATTNGISVESMDDLKKDALTDF